jgi:hypothetical protein
MKKAGREGLPYEPKVADESERSACRKWQVVENRANINFILLSPG